MPNIEGDIWSAVITAFLNSTTLTYTITAEDNAGNIATIDELEYAYTIPEFSSYIMLLTLMASTIAASVIHRRKRCH